MRSWHWLITVSLQRLGMGVQTPPTSRSHLKVWDTPSASVAEATDRYNTLDLFILGLNVGINSSPLSYYGELVFLIESSRYCSFRSSLWSVSFSSGGHLLRSLNNAGYQRWVLVLTLMQLEGTHSWCAPFIYRLGFIVNLFCTELNSKRGSHWMPLTENLKYSIFPQTSSIISVSLPLLPWLEPVILITRATSEWLWKILSCGDPSMRSALRWSSPNLAGLSQNQQQLNLLTQVLDQINS